jgi:hypothetical protein
VNFSLVSNSVPVVKRILCHLVCSTVRIKTCSSVKSFNCMIMCHYISCVIKQLPLWKQRSAYSFNCCLIIAKLHISTKIVQTRAFILWQHFPNNVFPILLIVIHTTNLHVFLCANLWHVSWPVWNLLTISAKIVQLVSRDTFEIELYNCLLWAFPCHFKSEIKGVRRMLLLGLLNWIHYHTGKQFGMTHFQTCTRAIANTWQVGPSGHMELYDRLSTRS